MRTALPRVGSRPPRRRLRVLGWTFLLLSLPPLGWLIYNRIDEAPSADALRWGRPPPNTIADADNAWLYLFGIGAAADDDPVALARRRVAIYEARNRQTPRPAADASETQAGDVLPQVKPDASIDSAGELCPFRETDCIAWAQQHGALLQRLTEANRIRLQRLDTLLNLQGWYEVPTLSLDMPIPDSDIFPLQLNLLAQRGADPAAAPAVAAQLARHVAFWRRVAEQSQWLVSKIVAFAYIERCQRLLAEVVARAGAAERDAMQADMATVLAPPSAAQSNLDVVASEHSQSTCNGLRAAVPGLHGALRQCVHGEAKNGSCAQDLLMSATFLPQATCNIVGRLDTAMAAFLAATPAEEEQAGEVYAALVERENPLHDQASIWRLYGYNGTGKVLAFIAIPKSDWRRRLNDYEAIRRMLAIKVAAVQRGVPAAAMPALLTQQPTALRNPYGNTAFGWDAQRQEITYAPRAKDYWKKEQIEITYRPLAALPKPVAPAKGPGRK